jgi:uncharacterized protein YacL
MLFAKRAPEVVVTRDYRRSRVTEGHEIIREVMDMNGAVRPEIMIQDKKYVTHLRVTRL